MGKYVIVQNNVGEMIAIEAGKEGNRIGHGTYEAINSKDALNKHFLKTGGNLKTKDDHPIKTNVIAKPDKISESSSRMMLLHFIHFLALFGVNLHQKIEVSGSYFKTSSSSWDFTLNPTAIIAVLISWIACSVIGSILKRVTMTYNNSIK